MKRSLPIFLTLLAMTGCQITPPGGQSPGNTANGPTEPFKPLEVSPANRRISPEALWALGRVTLAGVSPDGAEVLYEVSRYSLEQNRSNTDLFTISPDGTRTVQRTVTDHKESSATWLDAKTLAFLSNESGSYQVWTMALDGSSKSQVTEVEGGVSGFLFSPDRQRLLYAADAKVGQTMAERHPDLPQANALVYDDLMYRHWDHWQDEKRSHLFVAELEDGKAQAAIDLLSGQPFDSPIKPFGGMEQVAWSPDGSQVAYTCKKLSGRDYATSTNSEIYLYNINTKATTNLTEGNRGYDMNPAFSPDGKQMAWLSMERDGFEADKSRLMVMDLATRQKRDLTERFDQSVGQTRWSADGKQLFFISGIHATYQLYRLDLADGSITQLTEGPHDYKGFDIGPGWLVGARQSMSLPTELFTLDLATSTQKQLTFTNKALLDQMDFGKVEERWVNTTDGKRMLTWVIYPPDFDSTKAYPTLLYCQGGPQSAVSQFWSYRWNFQLMAANGYVIVAPNRRGLPTFGQEWNDQISGDYGGQNMQDYLSAIDELAREPFVDRARMGAVGASYGGLSVFWLAGNHQGRFKAFVSHCGIFNFESMYSTTEESFFVDWDMGGPYWAPETPNSYGDSPHRFIDKWDAPILVIHGGKDFRVPYAQGMGAFNSARLRGVEARFLFFPEESHWVLGAQNGVLWHREYFKWLDAHLK